MQLVGVLQSSTADDSLVDSRSPGGGKQKRRDDGTKVCGVCADKAFGVNFEAICCESCKAFFRRNALKEKVCTAFVETILR